METRKKSKENKSKKKRFRDIFPEGFDSQDSGRDLSLGIRLFFVGKIKDELLIFYMKDIVHIILLLCSLSFCTSLHAVQEFVSLSTV